MAKPVAYFGYSKVGSVVTFKNLSTGNPTSYQWDFGDSSPIDTTKDPNHTYGSTGYFSVTLTATNTDGESSVTITIGIGDTTDALDLSILEMVDLYLPAGDFITSSLQTKVALIGKWQIYLQPLVYYPKEVLEENIHNENEWPGLVNNLIAQLVAFDILLMELSKLLVMAGILSQEEESEEEGGGEPTGTQQIKTVKTGPAETEFYQDTVELNKSETIKNVASAMSAGVRANGLIVELKNSICQQASYLDIQLSIICGDGYDGYRKVVIGKRRWGHYKPPLPPERGGTGC